MMKFIFNATKKKVRFLIISIIYLIDFDYILIKIMLEFVKELKILEKCLPKTFF